MIGYVYLSSGALHTTTPERYAARREQIKSITFAIEALGGDPKGAIFIEKVPHVSNLQSLPTLRMCLHTAYQSDKIIFVDDVRRVFFRCPRQQRAALYQEIRPFASMIFEVARSGAAMSTRSEEELKDLVRLERPVRYRIERKVLLEASKPKRIAQTKLARLVSAKRRGAAADRRAERLNEIKQEMLQTRSKVSNAALAKEANLRKLPTTRGGSWSAASVKRALDRVRVRVET
jgi:hypothetical protein